jgi:hypothetical protein
VDYKKDALYYKTATKRWCMVFNKIVNAAIDTTAPILYPAALNQIVRKTGILESARAYTFAKSSFFAAVAGGITEVFCNCLNLSPNSTAIACAVSVAATKTALLVADPTTIIPRVVRDVSDVTAEVISDIAANVLVEVATSYLQYQGCRLYRMACRGAVSVMKHTIGSTAALFSIA